MCQALEDRSVSADLPVRPAQPVRKAMPDLREQPALVGPGDQPVPSALTGTAALSALLP